MPIAMQPPTVTELTRLTAHAEHRLPAAERALAPARRLVRADRTRSWPKP